MSTEKMRKEAADLKVAAELNSDKAFVWFIGAITLAMFTTLFGVVLLTSWWAASYKGKTLSHTALGISNVGLLSVAILALVCLGTAVGGLVYAGWQKKASNVKFRAADLIDREEADALRRAMAEDYASVKAQVAAKKSQEEAEKAAENERVQAMGKSVLDRQAKLEAAESDYVPAAERVKNVSYPGQQTKDDRNKPGGTSGRGKGR